MHWALAIRWGGEEKGRRTKVTRQPFCLSFICTCCSLCSHSHKHTSPEHPCTSLRQALVHTCCCGVGGALLKRFRTSSLERPFCCLERIVERRVFIRRLMTAACALGRMAVFVASSLEFSTLSPPERERERGGIAGGGDYGDRGEGRQREMLTRQ